jgi:hypothetical protein
MTGRFTALFATGLLALAATAAPSSAQQQPACQYYQVAAPTLNVFAKPDGDASFVGTLARNDFVCVIGEQDVTGDRTWSHIAAKITAPSKRTAMDGWAIKSALQPASASDVAALGAPPPAPAQSPPPAATPSPKNLSAPAAASSPPAPAAAPSAQDSVTFNGTIKEGPTPINGSSLAQLVQSVPEFSPIEGLPEDAWKKTCNNCHQWNQQSLCVQAKLYVNDPKMMLRIQHPFGGPEKVAMMKWAQGGCK